ncbi:MAG: nuclear transport factor 2 family protein [Phycisphaerales bacterium]|nr:nuclear transport factor 2 family protein [Phycisphaerales bacterium]
MHRFASILALTAAAAVCSADQTIREIPVEGGATIRVTLSTPDGANLKDPIPVVIVFPPGNQTSKMEGAARAMFHDECLKRGWALATPLPPEGTLFFQKPELFRALASDLDKAVVPEGGKYHAAGSSNGGRSALAFALELPARTASVAAFPGAFFSPPPEAETTEKLKGIPIRLWVGGDDTVAWNDASKAIEAYAKKTNGAVDATLTIVPGQGHVIRSLSAAMVLDELDKARNGKGTMLRPNLDALATLDALHSAASKSDFDAYFALYTPDAVFIGTDAAERWTIDEFKAYARPHFQKGPGKGGWTYTPRPGTRHVTIDPSTTLAFFDELLDNENYGTTRGTGVLRKVGEGEAARWMVVQYSLSIPIPNPIAKRVAAMVKTEEAKK